jgi:hypothetical protein
MAVQRPVDRGGKLPAVRRQKVAPASWASGGSSKLFWISSGWCLVASPAAAAAAAALWRRLLSRMPVGNGLG